MLVVLAYCFKVLLKTITIDDRWPLGVGKVIANKIGQVVDIPVTHMTTIYSHTDESTDALLAHVDSQLTHTLTCACF